MPLLRLDRFTLTTGGHATLDLAAGECVCLSGPSGIGKTLLLRALADLDPHAGGIWLEGQPQETISPIQWRKTVAYLAAESRWWGDAVAEHFPTPLPPEILAELLLPAEAMQWPVNRLSSGERQRLALLRLLHLNQPRVLLLDEPTANLDPETALLAEGLIQRYGRERPAAILWVSHDPRQIRRVGQRRFCMTEQGLHEDLP